MRSCFCLRCLPRLPPLFLDTGSAPRREERTTLVSSGRTCPAPVFFPLFLEGRERLPGAAPIGKGVADDEGAAPMGSEAREELERRIGEDELEESDEPVCDDALRFFDAGAAPTIIGAGGK